MYLKIRNKTQINHIWGKIHKYLIVFQIFKITKYYKIYKQRIKKNKKKNQSNSKLLDWNLKIKINILMKLILIKNNQIYQMMVMNKVEIFFNQIITKSKFNLVIIVLSNYYFIISLL